MLLSLRRSRTVGEGSICGGSKVIGGGVGGNGDRRVVGSLGSDGIVGGIAVGAVPIVAAVAMASAGTSRPLPGFLVRKEVKERGTEKQVEGNMIDGGNVLIVEDVTTTGGSSMQAIDAVKRERNGNVPIVVTIVDRLQGAQENFRMKGIRLISLLDKDDFAN